MSMNHTKLRFSLMINAHHLTDYVFACKFETKC